MKSRRAALILGLFLSPAVFGDLRYYSVTIEQINCEPASGNRETISVFIQGRVNPGNLDEKLSDDDLVVSAQNQRLPQPLPLAGPVLCYDELRTIERGLKHKQQCPDNQVAAYLEMSESTVTRVFGVRPFWGPCRR